MIVAKVKETDIADTQHNIDVRKLYDKDTAQAMHIKLETGESSKTHNKNKVALKDEICQNLSIIMKKE